jgi:hypothetical protein
VLRADAFEVLRDLGERFIPADALPASGSTANRVFQTVLIVMNILQGNGFRTDVAATEWIVFVTANVQPLKGLNIDLDTTDRFAKIAGAIVGSIHVSSHGAKTGSRMFFLYSSKRLPSTSAVRYC